MHISLFEFYKFAFATSEHVDNSIEKKNNHNNDYLFIHLEHDQFDIIFVYSLRWKTNITNRYRVRHPLLRYLIVEYLLESTINSTNWCLLNKFNHYQFIWTTPMKKHILNDTLFWPPQIVLILGHCRRHFRTFRSEWTLFRNEHWSWARQ